MRFKALLINVPESETNDRAVTIYAQNMMSITNWIQAVLPKWASKYPEAKVQVFESVLTMKVEATYSLLKNEVRLESINASERAR